MEQVPQILGIIAVSFIIFLVCRELWCWYWKINRIVELLETIAANGQRDIKINQTADKLGPKQLF
jgi:hypothetical protein